MCMAATHKQMWSIAPLPVFTHSNFFLVASFFHLTKGLLFFSTHANGTCTLLFFAIDLARQPGIAETVQFFFVPFLPPVLLQGYYHSMMWLATYPSFTAHVLRFCCRQCNLKVVEVTRLWRPNCQSKVQLWATTTQNTALLAESVLKIPVHAHKDMPLHVILEI